MVGDNIIFAGPCCNCGEHLEFGSNEMYAPGIAIIRSDKDHNYHIGLYCVNAQMCNERTQRGKH